MYDHGFITVLDRIGGNFNSYQISNTDSFWHKLWLNMSLVKNPEGKGVKSSPDLWKSSDLVTDHFWNRGWLLRLQPCPMIVKYFNCPCIFPEFKCASTLKTNKLTHQVNNFSSHILQKLSSLQKRVEFGLQSSSFIFGLCARKTFLQNHSRNLRRQKL